MNEALTGSRAENDRIDPECDRVRSLDSHKCSDVARPENSRDNMEVVLPIGVRFSSRGAT